MKATFYPKRCLLCVDMFGELADVSFGDIEFYEIDDGIETLINPLKVNKRFASSIYSIVKSIFGE